MRLIGLAVILTVGLTLPPLANEAVNDHLGGRLDGFGRLLLVTLEATRASISGPPGRPAHDAKEPLTVCTAAVT